MFNYVFFQETPLYFFLLFIFFTSLVDDALIIEYFMTVFGHQSHTTTVCQFLTFTSMGNRLLQVWRQEVLAYFFKWAIPGLFFFIFVFSIVASKYVQCKILPMTILELRTSSFGSDHTANWATTTAQVLAYFATLSCSKISRQAITYQCDQIGQFIGLRETFQKLWQQLVCPNLPHS